MPYEFHYLRSAPADYAALLFARDEIEPARPQLDLSFMDEPFPVYAEQYDGPTYLATTVDTNGATELSSAVYNVASQVIPDLSQIASPIEFATAFNWHVEAYAQQASPSQDVQAIELITNYRSIPTIPAPLVDYLSNIGTYDNGSGQIYYPVIPKPSSSAPGGLPFVSFPMPANAMDFAAFPYASVFSACEHPRTSQTSSIALEDLIARPAIGTAIIPSLPTLPARSPNSPGLFSSICWNNDTFVKYKTILSRLCKVYHSARPPDPPSDCVAMTSCVERFYRADDKCVVHYYVPQTVSSPLMSQLFKYRLLPRLDIPSPGSLSTLERTLATPFFSAPAPLTRPSTIPNTILPDPSTQLYLYVRGCLLQHN